MNIVQYYMSTLTRRKKEYMKRRANIIKSAYKLLNKKGYKHVTIKAIAEATDLSKGTIYLYFKNKDELLASLIVDCTEGLITKLKSVSIKKKKGSTYCEELFHVYLSYAKHNYACFKLGHEFGREIINDKILSNSPVLTKLEKYKDSILNIFRQAIEKGALDKSLRSDLDPLKSAIVVGILSESLLDYVLQPKFCKILKEKADIKTNEIINEYFQLVLRSFQPDKKININ